MQKEVSLNDKAVDFSDDMIALITKEDTRVDRLIYILYRKELLSADDIKEIYSA